MCTKTDRIASAETRLIKLRPAFLSFLAKRLGNRAEAEDVLQEFCVRVLIRKGQLRDAGRMDAWLYAVLRSTLNDHFRSTGRAKRLREGVAREATTGVTSEDAAEDMAVICQCIRELVTDLRPSDADLIRRVDLNEDARTDVAADLGLRPGTLNVRLHRARAALGDALAAHCGPCCRDGFDDCACGTRPRPTHAAGL